MANVVVRVTLPYVEDRLNVLPADVTALAQKLDGVRTNGWSSSGDGHWRAQFLVRGPDCIETARTLEQRLRDAGYDADAYFFWAPTFGAARERHLPSVPATVPESPDLVVVVRQSSCQDAAEQASDSGECDVGRADLSVCSVRYEDGLGLRAQDGGDGLFVLGRETPADLVYVLHERLSVTNPCVEECHARGLCPSARQEGVRGGMTTSPRPFDGRVSGDTGSSSGGSERDPQSHHRLLPDEFSLHGTDGNAG